MSAGSDDDLFLKEMRNVTPLDDRMRVPRQTQRRARPRLAPDPQLAVDGAYGRTPGVDDREFAKLCAGQVPFDLAIDLHRLRVEDATAMVRKRIVRAASSGTRCILVVHGRGRHSGGVSALRDTVIHTLTTTPTAHHVRAFCPAHVRDGGVGAMYVLIRPRSSTRPRRQ